MNKLADQKHKNKKCIMTHYKMLDRVPSVAITSNRNELKLYKGNIVYLNHGDNFELRFFNPTTFKIGVEIMFNGIKKGDGYLVLNPGQDLILDRFLDEQRKMLFETYTINGNDQEAREAIEKNGIISFNFYKEYYNNYRQNDVNVKYDFPPKPKTYSSCFSGTLTNSSNIGTSRSYDVSNMTNLSCSQNIFSSDLSDCISSVDGNYLAQATLDSFELETGRIEKGEKSNQKLKTVELTFEFTPFHSVIYQIMPRSTMNKTVKNVRLYCTGCGYRLRNTSWQFCPKCSTKIT
jgi:hypothetical protein